MTAKQAIKARCRDCLAGAREESYFSRSSPSLSDFGSTSSNLRSKFLFPSCVLKYRKFFKSSADHGPSSFTKRYSRKLIIISELRLRRFRFALSSSFSYKKTGNLTWKSLVSFFPILNPAPILYIGIIINYFGYFCKFLKITIDN